MVVLTEDLVLQKTRSEGLDSVRNLNLWGSDLTDVSILQRMPNVEVLSLSVNKIRSLKDFRNCRFLTELYLRKNDIYAADKRYDNWRIYVWQIQDLMEVTHLQGLPNLQILWLCDNPECLRECMDLIETVLIDTSNPYTLGQKTANIIKLDNIDVSVKERTDAIDVYGHLTPTHTPNHTGMDVSLLGGDQVTGGNLRSPTLRTPAAAVPSSSILQASPGPLRDSALSRGSLPPASVNGLGMHAMRQSSRAPSNVLYAVMALVKELDGDQLLAVQSEVSLRLQLLESSRQ